MFLQLGTAAAVKYTYTMKHCSNMSGRKRTEVYPDLFKDKVILRMATTKMYKLSYARICRIRFKS